MRLHKACWVLVLAALTTTFPALAQDAGSKSTEGKSTPTTSSAGKAPDAAGTKTTTGATTSATTKAGASASGATGASATTGGAATTTATGSATAATTGAPSGAPPPTTAPESMDGSTYVVRLRDLEQRIDELKEQIRRSHTRLSLLSDTILSGGVGGARAEIKFTNDMSNAFKLTRALFVLDGAVQYNKQDDTGALSDQKEIPIFSGSIPPGDHTLQVLISLRGHGYGVFSYLRGYKFDVKSSHSFTITEGKTIEVDAVAWEKGGVTTPLEQRPAVRYSEKVKSGLTEGSAPAPASRPGAPASSPNKAGASGSFSVGTGGK
jgi:hypothetical protein